MAQNLVGTVALIQPQNWRMLFYNSFSEAVATLFYILQFMHVQQLPFTMAQPAPVQFGMQSCIWWFF